MEFVKETTLWWSAVSGHESDEIAGYKLYMTEQSVPMERQADGSVQGAQEFDLGKPDVEGGKCSVNLALLPNMTTNDGVYNLGVVAVDDAGNESSFAHIPEVALDFVAPDAPSEAGIERS